MNLRVETLYKPPYSGGGVSPVLNQAQTQNQTQTEGGVFRAPDPEKVEEIWRVGVKLAGELALHESRVKKEYRKVVMFIREKFERELIAFYWDAKMWYKYDPCRLVGSYVGMLEALIDIESWVGNEKVRELVDELRALVNEVVDNAVR